MDIAFRVAEIVAPVFLLAAVGWGWVRAGIAYDVAFVTRLAMTLAIPCLIFVALMTSEIDPGALRDTAIASLVAYGAVALTVLALMGFAGFEMRTFWPPMTFGNTGNIGLPIALFAFGAEGLDYAVVIFAIMAFLSFTLGVWVVSGTGSVLVALREPMVAATLLGGLFLVMGWQTPGWLTASLDLVGQLGIPLMLITLGVAISRLAPGGVGRAVFLSLVKLAICVPLALAAGLAVGLSGAALGVLVVQVSTPVAVTNYMLAEKYKARADEVAGLVVASTLLSVVAIPTLLAFFV